MSNNWKNLKKQAYIVASEAAWIDISNLKVHKGPTVTELQRILHVTPEETMVFGDGLNDVELFIRTCSLQLCDKQCL